MALNAYRASRGNVTDACNAANICRGTWYLWVNGDEEFKAEVDAVKEELVDFYEKQLQTLAQGATYEALTNDGEIVTLRDKPSAAATIFALKTLGKSRGYVEKQEIDMNVQPVVIQSAVDGTDTH